MCEAHVRAVVNALAGRVDPLVAEEAVALGRVGAADLVCPAPVGIEHDGGILELAAERLGTVLDRHGQVDLLFGVAGLLTGSRAEEAEGERQPHDATHDASGVLLKLKSE
jgi:hypothetical protein